MVAFHPQYLSRPDQLRIIDSRHQDQLLAPFPTPTGSDWRQVQIRLLDGHTASIVVGPAHGVYNFAQMGLVNRKNGNPSMQWQLLKAFAAGGGVLTWRSPQADRRNQKRRELLARSLREFFRIDSDPFSSQKNGWRARFTIGGPE
jgi:hypothetical protein